MTGERPEFDGELDSLLFSRPFAPSCIMLTSGDRYEITRARQVAIGAETVVVMHPREGITSFRKNQIAAVDPPGTAT